MTQDGDVVREREFGLKLPDDSIIWPPRKFHGVDFNTPVERQRIVDSIAVSEANLGFAPGQLAEQYGWAKRTKITAVVYADYDDTLIPLGETGYVPLVADPDDPLEVETTEAGD